MKKKFLKKSGQDSEFGWIAPGGEHLAKPDAWKQFLGHVSGMAANSEQAETLARALHAGAIEKHNIEHFSRTGKTWIAPGGEHLLTPEARRMFLQRNEGDAEAAKRDHWRTIQDHNDLYLKDKQPRGLSGTISGFKTGTLTQDPAAAAEHWRYTTQTPPPPWTVKPGKSSAETRQEHIKDAEDALTTSLDELSEPAKRLVHPENWNRHGLQNSFGKMRTNLKKSKEDSVTVSSIGSPQKGITSVGSSWKATQIKPPTVPKIKTTPVAPVKLPGSHTANGSINALGSMSSDGYGSSMNPIGQAPSAVPTNEAEAVQQYHAASPNAGRAPTLGEVQHYVNQFRRDQQFMRAFSKPFTDAIYPYEAGLEKAKNTNEKEPNIRKTKGKNHDNRKNDVAVKAHSVHSPSLAVWHMTNIYKEQ